MYGYTYKNNNTSTIVFQCIAFNIEVADALYYIFKGVYPIKQTHISVIIEG